MSIENFPNNQQPHWRMALSLLTLGAMAASLPHPLSAQMATLSIEDETDNQTPATHELTWTAIAGRDYNLETSPDLSSWDPMPGFPVPGSGDEEREPIQFSGAPAFFRLEEITEQLLNLPVPGDGTRIDTQAELDGPKWPDTYGEGHVTLY